MSRPVGTRWTFVGVTLGLGVTLVLALGVGVFAGTGVAAGAAVPVSTSPPTITGSPQEGRQLTGDRGSWGGSPTQYTYAWMRCDAVGGACSAITGASATTYTLVLADVGSTIRFKVEARNADGVAFDSSAPTAVIVAAARSAPQNTSQPTITGTPREGQRLTGDRGKWSGTVADYNDVWVRCDKDGGSCSNISGADRTTYTLTARDVGTTLRFTVEARNAVGSTFASSVPTAVIVSATKPAPTPATGCPAGTGVVQIAELASPARLLIDGQQADPAVVRAGAQQLRVRYHVTACGGRPVQGALVYATAVPFNQLTIPAEQPTGQDGWARLDFRMLAGFPVGPKQQLIAVFVRARKTGENTLGGISTRRLFSIPVNLRG